MTEQVIFSVAEFSGIVRDMLEGAFGKLKIRGEISGLKKHSSGTYYFDLKESAGGKDFAVNCVLWKWTKVDVALAEGLEVVLTGKATTYGARSSYQITVEAAEIAGEGAILKLIEERKKKLLAAGVFDAARKKSLPFFPRVIGVITSPTGAVIQDILHRVGERFPCHVIIYPSAVQGVGAELEVATGVRYFNSAAVRPDVIIIARGGGSVMDLMPFNSEEIAMAIYESEIPIISAVGHETDTTICDLAADVRAPTPTAAAEIATPVMADLKRRAAEGRLRVAGAAARALELKKLMLSEKRARVKNPMQIIEDLLQRLDDKRARVVKAAADFILARVEKLGFAGKLLASLSPVNVLKRGYAMVIGVNGVITSATTLKTAGRASVKFADGEVEVSTANKHAQGDLF
ncbi:MAG: exodeoxyribonuclease VII large subunit [Alphaproteobacteria bacterium]|nr:exodeoxyribonuclease VII large subunit [Alphaproteobacteria bacterium]